VKIVVKDLDGYLKVIGTLLANERISFILCYSIVLMCYNVLQLNEGGFCKRLVCAAFVLAAVMLSYLFKILCDGN
jgi:hypothetical protein